ncbi:MAG: DUF2442 domain-containing protein [Bacteroidales bacterium]|nr:DUF2442 domain-containing protein [Bacteroidales bacterium]
MRKNNKENLNTMSKVVEIIAAKHVRNYILELSFSDGKKINVDFGEFLNKRPHVQHDKYKSLKLFKSFRIEDGNVVWGKDWDMIFPLEQLYAGKIKI